MIRRLDRDTTVQGLMAEFRAFADLIGGLSDAEWNAPTRCDGWLVRDVAAHVLGNVVDVITGTPGDRSPDDQAAALRGGTPAEHATALRAAVDRLEPRFARLTDELWAAPGPVDRTIGNGVTMLWYDAYVHTDDVRAALGRPAETGPGLDAALSWLRDELEGRVAVTLRLDGFPEAEVGGGGTVVTGDPHRFVLVATGRLDASVLGLPAEVNVHGG
ncbi:maleylpyruvate isomerase family mycothiol-dependent enzyme [Actinomadura harenae]|uniref:Maleylpyruvate isomerase family mycothiol-dependent enzyme n=1 Tax=Actinomadura harenae TaxID=2483351 RepID=A0A3M2LGY2_9ACTN|nr:maleylpyruvate isomerase family mycothiol-dependent enzyme [Actinomadura harenae]RMI36336.1 maleylpyruvate isomerase family mycothiol-dependent enzyme [Actinomadura harenae]